jgi:hypothetical protein
MAAEEELKKKKRRRRKKKTSSASSSTVSPVVITKELLEEENIEVSESISETAEQVAPTQAANPSSVQNESEKPLGIQDISAYIQSMKQKSSPSQTVWQDATRLVAMDGTDLQTLPGVYAVVPHAKGDHKLVYLRQHAPVDMWEDDKGRVKGGEYRKQDRLIYKVFADFKRDASLLSRDGEHLDIWLIDNPKDLDDQLMAIRQSEWGWVHFWSPVIVADTLMVEDPTTSTAPEDTSYKVLDDSGTQLLSHDPVDSEQASLLVEPEDSKGDEVTESELPLFLDDPILWSWAEVIQDDTEIDTNGINTDILPSEAYDIPTVSLDEAGEFDVVTDESVFASSSWEWGDDTREDVPETPEWTDREQDIWMSLLESDLWSGSEEVWVSEEDTSEREEEHQDAEAWWEYGTLHENLWVLPEYAWEESDIVDGVWEVWGVEDWLLEDELSLPQEDPVMDQQIEAIAQETTEQETTVTNSEESASMSTHISLEEDKPVENPVIGEEASTKPSPSETVALIDPVLIPPLPVNEPPVAVAPTIDISDIVLDEAPGIVQDIHDAHAPGWVVETFKEWVDTVFHTHFHHDEPESEPTIETPVVLPALDLKSWPEAMTVGIVSETSKQQLSAFASGWSEEKPRAAQGAVVQKSWKKWLILILEILLPIVLIAMAYGLYRLMFSATGVEEPSQQWQEQSSGADIPVQKKSEEVFSWTDQNPIASKELEEAKTASGVIVPEKSWGSLYTNDELEALLRQYNKEVEWLRIQSTYQENPEKLKLLNIIQQKVSFMLNKIAAEGDALSAEEIEQSIKRIEAYISQVKQ